MKWMRRTHMYAGLFLAPWVLVYGLSGFVFNHFAWFAEEDTNQIRWMLEPSAATHRLDADTLARKVVAALNQTAGDGDAPSAWRVPADSRPRFEGQITQQGEAKDGGSVVLVLDPDGEHGATFRGPPPIHANKIALDANESAMLRVAQDEMVAAATVAEPALRDARFDDASFPPLALQLEREGLRQDASYDLRSGELTLRAPPAPRALNPREFLTRLHTTAGYPGEEGAVTVITVRAMFVDLMACAMCFWAISGLAMWWQLKSLRRPGSAVIVATLIVAGLVWSGMYRYFSSGG